MEIPTPQPMISNTVSEAVHNLQNYWQSIEEKCKTIEELVDEAKKHHIISIQNKNLIQIPEEILEDDSLPAELDVLDLSRNSIKKIPNSIMRLRSLQALNLSYNNISTIPKEFFSLVELMALDLSFNHIREVPEMLYFLLPKLVYLNLSENHIVKISPNIENLIHLQDLQLGDNKIEFIPSEIENLVSLGRLGLQGNQLVTPPHVGKMAKLVCLDLQRNLFVDLPDFESSVLEELNIENNYLDETSFGKIQNLTNLKALMLSSNNFKKLPEFKGTCVKKVMLGRNNLTMIPLSLSDLPYLMYLDVRNNQIDSLKPIIGLKKLAYLNVAHNILTEIPAEIGECTDLKIFYASHNKIRSIDENIEKCINISEMYLDHNQINALPVGIGKLTKLTKLLLQWNEISILPDDIANCTTLRYLDISRNQLCAFPKRFYRISSLRKLYAQNNRIWQIPENMKKMVTLMFFNFTENPVCQAETQLLECEKDNEEVEKTMKENSGYEQTEIDILGLPKRDPLICNVM